VHPPRLASLALALVACSGRETAGGDVARVQAASSISASPTPYRAAGAAPAGSVSGTVTASAAFPASTAAQVSTHPSCASDSLPAVAAGEAVAGAIVWLEGVNSGKPRPLERRYALRQERCVLTPRVLAVEAGGTVNVASDDPFAHRTRFIARPAGAVLATVRQVDAGQVVPEDRVAAQPGLVEIRCTQHPGTRGWLAVFDHPYYAVTDAAGRFQLDGVPAGTFTLVVWHERGERTAGPVTVRDGGAASVDVRVEASNR
jgi:hypothetical protein